MSSSQLSRRTALRLGTAVAFTGLTGCVGGGDSNSDGDEVDVEITLGSTYEPGDTNVQLAENFAEMIEEETDGNFLIDVVPGGAYGGEANIVELNSEQILEMHVTGSQPYFMFSPEYDFFQTPFVLAGWDNTEAVIESEEFQPAHQNLIDEANQTYAGKLYFRGERQFATNTPVRRPEDAEGIDMRVPDLESFVEIWRTAGVAPTTIALDELYSAIDQGVAEAMDGNVYTMDGFGVSEVLTHLNLIESYTTFGGLYYNVNWKNNLDETYSDLIDEVAMEETENIEQVNMDEEEAMIDSLESEGMTIVEDVETDTFRERVAPTVREFFDNRWEGNLEMWQNI